VYSVVNAFREEFPTRTIAVMTDREDVCLKLWSAARSISLFRKPVVIEELTGWMEQLRRSLRPAFHATLG